MESLVLNVITHLHTKASNGPASSLDRMANSILGDIFGTIPEDLIWRECFTGAEDIRQILAGHRTGVPIDLIFLTDHMSSRHHRLAPESLCLAVDERRIGIGCEIQTVHFSERAGGYRIAPEVLIYGDGADRIHDGRPYTGVDDQLLKRLYEHCTVAGAAEPEITEVAKFCRENRIACALAHPFDCQQLDLEETLALFDHFTFVETVNGGFPRSSAEALQEYVAFHNAILAENLASDLQACDFSDSQRCRIRQIARSHLLVALGGSDAHLNNFDRVVTRFRTEAGRRSAGDFVRTMLTRSAAELLEKKIVEPQGRGISMTGLYLDVLGIVWKNLRTNGRHFCRPAVWPALFRTLATTGAKELKVRIVRNKSIAHDYRQLLDIPALQARAEAMVGARRSGGGLVPAPVRINSGKSL